MFLTNFSYFTSYNTIFVLNWKKKKELQQVLMDKGKDVGPAVDIKDEFLF